MRLACVLLVVGLGSCRPGVPSLTQVPGKNISANLEAIRQDNKLPGIALAIFDAQHMLAYGFRGHHIRPIQQQARLWQQVSPWIEYPTLSASAIMRLVQQQPFSLKTTLGEVFWIGHSPRTIASNAQAIAEPPRWYAHRSNERCRDLGRVAQGRTATTKTRVACADRSVSRTAQQTR